LSEVIKNGLPHLEVQYTTRFNAFLNPLDPWDYLDPNSTHPKALLLTMRVRKCILGWVRRLIPSI